ncbi:Os11g0678100 [Oryza sativa Japonica Group]|uniref:Os11g0678100 protein n=1 Tax=Oryza sativa subsp. japonica TaxID=39947 RepID=A0A0P0Y597_ORYSJ|nr:hypothetical protein EE612_057090 [Oryza sativa]BAT15236.1 Os11g0678100 [Oryza sativa Japonica Group]
MKNIPTWGASFTRCLLFSGIMFRIMALTGTTELIIAILTRLDPRANSICMTYQICYPGGDSRLKRLLGVTRNFV